MRQIIVVGKLTMPYLLSHMYYDVEVKKIKYFFLKNPVKDNDLGKGGRTWACILKAKLGGCGLN